MGVTGGAVIEPEEPDCALWSDEEWAEAVKVGAQQRGIPLPLFMFQILECAHRPPVALPDIEVRGGLIRVRNIVIDSSQMYLIWIDGNEQTLPRQQWLVLYRLMLKAGLRVSREELAVLLWNEGFTTERGSGLREVVMRLRKRLSGVAVITTKHGRGWVFEV